MPLLEIFPVPAAGVATAGAPVLLGIGFAPITPVEAAGVAATGTLNATAFWDIVPVIAAGVATTEGTAGGFPGSLSLVDDSDPLVIFRGQSLQVLSGAAVDESSRVVLTNNSARYGGKQHGVEVQISRGSGAGDVTVRIEGRADRNAPWANLYDLTMLAASSTAVVEEVPYMCEMRLTVTDAAAATVDGWIIA